MLRRAILLLLWVLVAGCMGFIAYMSLQEEPDVPRIGTLVPDYVNHSGAYLALAVIVYVALLRSWRIRLTTVIVSVVAWCLVFGLGMEFAQRYLTDTRHFSLTDLLADGVGATIGCLLLFALKRAGDKGQQLYRFLTGTP